MKSLVNAALACFFASLCSICTAQVVLQPQVPEIAARSYLLVDVTAKQVLAAKDIDASVEPASLTKLMTAYLVFDALRAKKITLQQRFGVSERAQKMIGSRMFIDTRMQVPVEDLIKGMVVQSGNDAAIALAEGVGGSVEHFVQMMNEQARTLGMQSTTYKNPEGLPAAGHNTSARDLSTLALRLMQDFPEYMPYYAIKKYRYPGTPATNDSNRNLLLLRDPTVDGLKTGHTEAAGYCMIATAKREFANLATSTTSAPSTAPTTPSTNTAAGSVTTLGSGAASTPASGSRRLLSVVLGTASDDARANESQKLLNWGFTAYEAVKLFDAGQVVASSPVWKGRADSVALGQAQPIVVAVALGSAGKLSTQVLRTEPVVAPVAKGQALGILRVMLGNKTINETPLVALNSVEESGFFGRTWDAMRLWIH